MEKRKLGEIEVSPVGMGCMGFSHGYGKIPDRQYSIDAIRKAYDYGCNFFDTAEVYGKDLYYVGHNEEIVGEAVEPFRDKVVIATKLHLGKDADENTDIDKRIREHLDASLKKLKTDYVDLYYLHRLNENVPVEKVAKVMGDLIKEGKIKGWGLSAVDVDTIKRAHEVTPLSAVQNIYSMVERDSEDEVIPYCVENNIGFVPFSPTASGLLSGKVTPDTKFGDVDDVRKFVPQLSKENIAANQPIVDMLKKVAKDKNATPVQISMAWMLKKYPNVVPIPGSKNQERILENLGTWNVELTDKEFEDLENALNSCKVYGHRGDVETEQMNFVGNWEQSNKFSENTKKKP